MITSLNTTANEFPGPFQKLNSLMIKIKEIASVSPSGRQLAMELLENACDRRIKELSHPDVNVLPSNEESNSTNSHQESQEISKESVHA